MANRFSKGLSRFGLVPLLVVLGLLSTRVLGVVVDSPDALHEALKRAKPGDVIELAPGEWKDAALRIRGEGTADAPITVRAAEPGKTILTGKSTVRIGGRHLVVDGLFFRDFVDQSHIVQFRDSEERPAEDSRLTNTAFDRPLRAEGEADVSSYHVSVYGRRNRVDHCTFGPKYTSAPTFTVWVNADGLGDHHRIDRNLFLGRPPLGKNGGETMRVGTSQVSLNNSRTIVEENYFEHCDGESEIISNKSCENIYRNNVFVASKGGLVLRHGNRCLVERNWFLGQGVAGTGGIRIIGEDHRVQNNYLEGLMGELFESAMPINDGIPETPLNGYFRVQRLTIANNSIIDCAQSLSFGVGHGARNRVEEARGVTVANNLIVSSHGPLVRFYSQPTDATWQGNVLFGAEPGIEHAGVRVVDPKLVADDHGIKRPSEPIDAGADIGKPIDRAETGVRWNLTE